MRAVRKGARGFSSLSRSEEGRGRERGETWDWRSDVCSSELRGCGDLLWPRRRGARRDRAARCAPCARGRAASRHYRGRKRVVAGRGGRLGTGGQTCALPSSGDAAIYFGRDDEVRGVIERLDARRAQGGARLLVII